MAIDTSLLQTAGVLPATDPTVGTGLYLTSGTTGSTSTSSLALQSTSSSKLGVLSDPSLYSYSTGVAASVGVIGGALLTGAVIAGVGLLSYAITKAALEP